MTSPYLCCRVLYCTPRRASRTTLTFYQSSPDKLCLLHPLLLHITFVCAYLEYIQELLYPDGHNVNSDK